MRWARRAMGVALVLSVAAWLAPTQADAALRLQPNASYLATVNFYRTASGLPAAADNPAWTTGIQHHLTYLRFTPSSYMTGPYANAHTENPASPWYTADGAAAGGSSNLAFASASPRQAIDVWMAAPFHAIGILQPELAQVGFARDPETGYAGIDVIRGLSGPSSSSPVLFPGPNATTHLTAFGGELPNPLEPCGYPSAGLPVIAMLPADPSPSLTASIVRDDGTNLQICVVDEHTFTSSDQVYGPTGQAILDGDNAVLVIPRQPLTQARHTVTINQPGQPPIQWSFFVSGLAGTPVEPGGIIQVHATDTPNATVLGNLTVTQPDALGFTTAYPCAAGRPLASNNNYVAGQTIPNFVVVKADANGDVCFYTAQRSHLVWDQVGATTAFPVTTAARLLDTRNSAKVNGGGFVTVHATGTPNATVLGNLTVTQPEAAGFTTAYPCAAGRPLASNNNYAAGQTIPNFVVVKADANGDVCFFTSQRAHLIWDQVGATTVFPVTSASRLLDTRNSAKVNGGSFVTVHATDTPNATVLGNLTVTQPEAAGFTTAYPCASGRPLASNNNYVAAETIPNFVVVKADANGDVCFFTSQRAHLIWDQVGATTAFTVSTAVRGIDTRSG